ncbi:MAG: PDZ domain-containing protein, partial [Myxococcota bacterium]
RTVALVRPGGPAVGSGLVAGDVIVSVGGHDVTGGSEYLYRPLTAVAPGTVVELGLEGGRIAKITAVQ